MINLIPKEEFGTHLLKKYNFGFTANSGRKKTIDDVMTLFNKSLKTKVIDRIDVLYDAAKYLVIEENYIEPEWKTMIAKHYINSAYSSTLKQSVIRVHFLSKNEFSQQSYLGFILCDR